MDISSREFDDRLQEGSGVEGGQMGANVAAVTDNSS